MRMILVTGTGRSGTSAVMGALHQLGVHVCSHIIDANEFNPLGYWECQKWWDVGNRMAFHGLTTDVAIKEYRRLVANHQREPVWAIKALWLYRSWPAVREALPDDVRVVVCHREFASTAASFEKHGGDRSKPAKQQVIERATGLMHALREMQYPRTFVDYDALVEERETEIDGLIEFVFEDLPQPTLEQRAQAIRFIKPELRHYEWGGVLV